MERKRWCEKGATRSNEESWGKEKRVERGGREYRRGEQQLEKGGERRCEGRKREERVVSCGKTGGVGEGWEREVLWGEKRVETGEQTV